MIKLRLLWTEFERNEDKINYSPRQDVSNGMRLDSERYLVPEKIDNLGEILTLIEWSITPLLVYEPLISFFTHLNTVPNSSPLES